MPSDYVQYGEEARDQAKAKDMNERVKASSGSQIKTSAAGLGAYAASRSKAKKAPPRQSDFGGDMKAFGEAMRKYRVEMDNEPETQAQKKALKSL
jgi:hypothetical protein